MSQIGVPLAGFYDYRVVALSVFIAISASYAALDLGGRVTTARGWIRSAWLAGGATAIGLGIWSMHFTGMLAFVLPIPVAYHWPTVLLSLLAAILAAGCALYVVSRKRMGRIQALVGNAFMGLGIVGMHYIGMAAMRLSAVCHYSPALVALSALIAALASLIALIFTFDYREHFRGTTPAKIISAMGMGAAIFLMHYIGMWSASFTASSVASDMLHAVSISSLGLIGIVTGTLVVQGGAIVTSAVDRRMARQTRNLQTSDASARSRTTFRSCWPLPMRILPSFSMSIALTSRSGAGHWKVSMLNRCPSWKVFTLRIAAVLRNVCNI